MTTQSMTARRVDAVPNFRFDVQVEGISYAMFSEIKLPTLSMDPIKITEGGQNQFIHKLPNRVDVGTVTLKHGFTQQRHMLEWYLQVLKGDITAATRIVVISLYTTDRSLIMTMILSGAYPIKWTGPSLQTDGNSVALDEVELAFHGLDIQ